MKMAEDTVRSGIRLKTRVKPGNGTWIDGYCDSCYWGCSTMPTKSKQTICEEGCDFSLGCKPLPALSVLPPK